jgi:hypothetical protein
MDNFENIPRVEIDQEGGYKFIIAVVYGGNGREKMVMWAREECDYHRDILAHFSERYAVIARCQGGGQIRVNPNEKKISVWGRSGDFGRPDYELVLQILQEEFEGWTIEGPRG